jgi:hypothetical protein
LDREKTNATAIADESKQSRWMPAFAGMTSLQWMT